MGFDEDDNPFTHHHKNKYDINSKIMLSAIISLSIVVFLVTILHMYIRCVIRRCRQAGRRATFSSASSLVTSTVSQVEPPKNGLDPSIIASLPIFVYKQSDDHNMDEAITNPIECSVCLSILENGEIVRNLPNCKHIFHVECIDKWFNCHSTCPICRAEAKPRLLSEPREGVVGRIPPSAPPLDDGNLSMVVNLEGTSSSGKTTIGGGGSSSRLSSFRRILSRERSSRRLQVVDPESNGGCRI
ncbi:PREDICTED: RING-H2 finger protein ATL40-like [Nicotiana attenuata]|uniref:RING-type E3 ubiquitin transferase n=1 Tax=Nicotiana attenuata TaxID=49451 RepID=A0A1J6KG74_NICAT|nr:PREDICTED: RING-H2 finger protein ATL40-like [Nicotiana attenuata]OIT21811.1 e3 ubiquitin-protein ligase atl41 [Nicotiana attenuata]